MSRLIIHIGTHKTATTTLQRHLARNRAALAGRGIWYPDYSLIGKTGHYAHLGIVNAFSAQHPKLSRQDAERFFAAVTERSRDYDATIISAEPFYRHIVYPARNAIPADHDLYWRQRDRYITRVRQLFGDRPAEIVVVFRRQADYAHSLYQEQVKVTRYRKGFAAFRREFWYHFDYLRQARAWARQFDGLAPLRFEDLVAGRDPIGRFAAHLGLDLSGPNPVDQQNVSLPPDVVAIKRILNATQLDGDEIDEDVEALLSGPLGSKLSRHGARSLYQSRDEMLAFQASFAEANATLLREFFPGLPADAPIFDDRFPHDCAYGDRIDPALMHEMIKLLR